MDQSSSLDAGLVEDFRLAMAECEALYRTSARLCIESHPHLAQPSPQEFHARMLDLHRGLLAKIYVTLVQADWHFSRKECRLAEELIVQLWGRRLSMVELRPAIQQLVDSASKLSWSALVGPFERLSPLRERIADLEAIVLRVANIVAKIDGHINADELRQLEGIQHELGRHLRPVSLADAPPSSRSSVRQATETVATDAAQVRQKLKLEQTPVEKVAEKSREERLAEALAELDKLIGLAAIKHDVRELTGFLQMQQQRAEVGLPQTKITLHMVFSGNPGTGKTTVARIIGRLFGAMGVLSKGHLVETDRSGLVAEYAGQTGPKANKKIDEALDGVLFIDEAYSLVAERGDDPFGAEAVQALLKRMEDDRQRLVVILAGYPEPLDRLLRSNPGLSSRFHRRLEFPDYSATDLGRIMQSMCERDHYRLPADTRARLLVGFQHLLDTRDEHFGNGRLVRNVFEAAIRRMATRIAGVAPLTRDILTVLHPGDIAMEPIEDAEWEELAAATPCFRVLCPGCQQRHLAKAKHLGKGVRCKKCGNKFTLDWGDPVAS